MLSPKRTKYRKAHKGRHPRHRQGRNDAEFRARSGSMAVFDPDALTAGDRSEGGPGGRFYPSIPRRPGGCGSRIFFFFFSPMSPGRKSLPEVRIGQRQGLAGISGWRGSSRGRVMFSTRWVSSTNVGTRGLLVAALQISARRPRFIVRQGEGPKKH